MTVRIDRSAIAIAEEATPHISDLARKAEIMIAAIQADATQNLGSALGALTGIQGAINTVFMSAAQSFETNGGDADPEDRPVFFKHLQESVDMGLFAGLNAALEEGVLGTTIQNFAYGLAESIAKQLRQALDEKTMPEVGQ